MPNWLKSWRDRPSFTKLMIELQGIAEAQSFSRPQLNQMLDLGENGIQQLLELQR